MHMIRHRHHTTLQHLLIDLFLLHALEFGFQILLVDRLPYRCGNDGLSDLLAQRMLFPERIPVPTGKIKPSVLLNLHIDPS